MNTEIIEKIEKYFDKDYLYITREQSMKYQGHNGGMLDWSLTDHLIDLRKEIVEFIKKQGDEGGDVDLFP